MKPGRSRRLDVGIAMAIKWTAAGTSKRRGFRLYACLEDAAPRRQISSRHGLLLDFSMTSAAVGSKAHAEPASDRWIDELSRQARLLRSDYLDLMGVLLSRLEFDGLITGDEGIMWGKRGRGGSYDEYLW